MFFSRHLQKPLRTLLAEVLASDGHPVRTAVDGLDALAQIIQRPPALLILDEQMPRLDGRGLVAALEAENLRGRFPILVLSASNRHLAALIAADAHLPKPFDLDQLLRTTAYLLSGKHLDAAQPSWGHLCEAKRLRRADFGHLPPTKEPWHSSFRCGDPLPTPLDGGAS